MKSGITLIDADGTNERPLTTESYVADHGIGVVWSPRGDQIAYQRERADCDRRRRATSAARSCSSPPPTPTRRTRSEPNASSRRSRDDDLQAAEEPWHANSVTWSPDGTQLLYSAGLAGLIAVPVDADRPPIVLSSDGLTGIQDEHATSPWIPLQQWQPSLTTRP